MIRPECAVCIDRKKYIRLVSDSRRILTGLQRYVSKEVREHRLTDKEKIEMSRLPVHHPVRFMCGQCVKINRSELVQLEEQIKETAYRLYCYFKYFKNNPNKGRKYEIQRLLAGHYPSLARLF